MPLISIIVPVYKVEKYLRKCIDSILQQTLKDFELILVNDGSPDSCGSICDEYAKVDSRIRVIHKKNGGLSDARNSGIEIAQGRYLGFIDSDDYIENDMYEVLYNNIVSNNADIAVCGYYDCYKNTIIPRGNSGKISIKNTEESVEMLKKMLPVAWNKLYKREIFKDIRYPYGKFNEDTFIIIDILMNCKKMVYIDIPKYYYLKRKNSIMKNSFNVKQLDIIEAWEKCLFLVEKYFPRQVDIIKAKYLGAYFQLIDKIVLMDNYKENEHYKRIKLKLKNSKKEILTSNHITLKRKIIFSIFLLSPQLYKLVLLNRNTNLILFD